MSKYYWETASSTSSSYSTPPPKLNLDKINEMIKKLNKKEESKKEESKKEEPILFNPEDLVL